MTPADAPPPASPADPPKVPLWKNPFVLAFAVGVVVLTAMPFLQNRTLRAPPPGPNVGAWSMRLTSDGGVVGSQQLAGKVWLASFTSDLGLRTEQGDILRHTQDLGDKVVLVTFVAPGEKGPEGNDRWLVVSGTQEEYEALALKQFLPAFKGALTTRFAGGFPDGFMPGSTLDDWRRVPVLGVVDQNGALRVFWKDEAVGRGNAINAARLLAKQGPTP